MRRLKGREYLKKRYARQLKHWGRFFKIKRTGRKWQLWFVVGVQSFMVRDFGTTRDLAFTRAMFCVALEHAVAGTFFRAWFR